MKRTISLFVCAVLLALLVTQAVQALTVTANGLQGATGRWSASYADRAGLYQPDIRSKGGTTSTDVTKAWLQFDLSSIWATYGRANLQSATISMTSGSGRSFEMYGVQDGYAENWDKSTLTWNNAPANDILNPNLPDLTHVYNGASMWPQPKVGVLIGAFTQYTSGDISSFLATDTDNLVTFIFAGGNQTLFHNVGSTTVGAIEPFLTLTFVPEPATVAILGLGGLFLRRRLA